jgi:hypothetical protein
VQIVQCKGAGNSAWHKSFAAFFHQRLYGWHLDTSVDLGEP